MKNIFKYLIIIAIIISYTYPSFATPLNIQITGKVGWKTAFTNQSKYFQVDHLDSKKFYSSKQNMTTETGIKILANNETDFGMKYGASIEFGDDTTFGKSGKDIYFENTFLFLESNLGKLEFGSHISASKTMKVDASNIGRATGGISGSFNSFINNKVGYLDTNLAGAETGKRIEATYLTGPHQPFNTSSHNGRFNKISYYTPEISGLQLGLTYALDSGDKGNYKGLTGKYLNFNTNTPGLYKIKKQYQNIFEVGMKYKFQYQKIDLELGIAGQVAKAEKVNPYIYPNPELHQKIHGIKAFNSGVILTYNNLSLAGSYGNWGKSLNTKQTDMYNKSTTSYYTLGAAYIHNLTGVSVTYFNSSRLKNKFTYLAFGSDYKLREGVLAYAETSFFKFKPAQYAYLKPIGGIQGDAKNNLGNITFVGIKYMF
ncbi:MAG: porin [Sphingobacteriia bacterium]|nr:porin [Sphingobacteriia bacterium]